MAMIADGLMNALCRGLVGYVSYLAPCRQSAIYSEYMLYEPIARIAKAQGWDVRAEVPIKRKREDNARGDHERVDFTFEKRDHRAALEVKWIKSQVCNVDKDARKLRSTNADQLYILLFGSGRLMNRLSVREDRSALHVHGSLVHWNAQKTHYGAVWLRIAK